MSFCVSWVLFADLTVTQGISAIIVIMVLVMDLCTAHITYSLMTLYYCLVLKYSENWGLPYSSRTVQLCPVLTVGSVTIHDVAD